MPPTKAITSNFNLGTPLSRLSKTLIALRQHVQQKFQSSYLSTCFFVGTGQGFVVVVLDVVTLVSHSFLDSPEYNNPDLFTKDRLAACNEINTTCASRTEELKVIVVFF